MEQHQETQVEEGLNLVGIFKLLLSKAKILLLTVLIGGILGGAFAVWQTVDVNHYGTRAEFYINPETKRDTTEENNSQYGVYGAYGKHVMDNMVKLLNSESFAEQMILNGEQLPEKDVWVNADDQKEVALGLNTKIDAANYELNKLIFEQETLETLLEARAVNAKELAKEKEALDNAWAGLYYTNKNIVTSPTFTEHAYRSSTIESIVEGDAEYATVRPTKEAYKAWSERRDAIDVQDDDIESQEELIIPLQESTEEVVELALEAWRQTAKYKDTLVKYSEAVEFTYLQDNESSSNANDFARSFIYVDIFVMNDQDFAEEVFERVKTIVPSYVEKNMTVPSGYVGTNCKRITRTDDITLTNPGYTTSQAIKYGILAAFAAFVIACVVVIFVDKMDKRLRDTSVLTHQLDVPILGMIPPFEELKKEAKAESTKDKEVK